MRIRVSYSLGVVLCVIATLPSVESPAFLQRLSLGTTLGRWLYLCSLAVVAVGIVVAHHREERQREQEQECRDREAKERHAELGTQVNDGFRDLKTSLLDDLSLTRKAVVAQSGSIAAPLLEAIDEAVAQTVTAEPAVSTWVVPKPSVVSLAGTIRSSARLMGTLSVIRENPPKTEDTVRVAAKQLRDNIRIIGYPPRVLVTRPDGTVEHDSDAPTPTSEPSTPS